jgi:hypothetical protein
MHVEGGGLKRSRASLLVFDRRSSWGKVGLRRLVHVNVTSKPTPPWVKQQSRAGTHREWHHHHWSRF